VNSAKLVFDETLSRHKYLGPEGGGSKRIRNAGQGLPDGIFSYHKVPISLYFLKAYKLKCLVYFLAIWFIL
jgi:hypothetical protein